MEAGRSTLSFGKLILKLCITKIGQNCEIENTFPDVKQ